MHRLTTFFCSACLATSVAASDNCTEDAMIVFDGSGSMAEMGFNQIDEPRIFEAREAVREVIPEVADNRHLGLIVYGPGAGDGCSGVDLRFGPMPDAAPRIIAEVNALQPEGKTALTEAVRRAAVELDYETKPAVIVLVTDGKETCGGRPCQLATSLRHGGLDTTVHVIGFKVRGDFFAWSRQGNDYVESEAVSRCLADETGGSYVHAETLDDLIRALRVTLGCNVLF